MQHSDCNSLLVDISPFNNTSMDNTDNHFRYEMFSKPENYKGRAGIMLVHYKATLFVVVCAKCSFKCLIS